MEAAEPMGCESVDDNDYERPIRMSITTQGTHYSDEGESCSDDIENPCIDWNTTLLIQQWQAQALAAALTTPPVLPPTDLQSLQNNFLGSQPSWGMGNGASGSFVVDGRHIDGEQIHRLINSLKEENSNAVEEKQEVLDDNDRLREELAKRDDLLREKNLKIKELNEEIDKLKCVIQQKVVGGKPDILSTISEVGHVSNAKKKLGISGESSQNITAAPSKPRYFEKDSGSKQLIKSAIKNNDFLKNLDPSQIHEIVGCMYSETFTAGQYIIKEGDAGDHFYVSAVGVLEVMKNGKVVGTLPEGRSFGELAILYGCVRTATIRAQENAQIWALERSVFQQIMMTTGIERQKERIEFLMSVKSLSQDLSQDKLSKIADVLEVDFFDENEYIIREGQSGDYFYIIAAGEVKVTQALQGYDEPQEIRKLGKGDYFGEIGLLHEGGRTANVLAMAPGVELLTLSGEAFRRHIGDVKEFRQKNYGDRNRGAEWLLRKIAAQSCNDDSLNGPKDSDDLNLAARSRDPSIESQYKQLNLNDLRVVTTLGTGGFGRVDLVVLKSDESKSFALKCLKKNHIVKTGQQQHVYAEKRIMLACNSPFIVKLHRTFRDSKYIYLMMDVCLGGELWTILRDSGHFDDATAKFCVACVIEAFRYLHTRKIVYRDLKPENLLVTTDGYIKLVDFGFAKNIPAGRKTWTFCGTPEYVAPEIILNRGHDHAVDIWATGILIYELTEGRPPFSSSEPLKTYNQILRGIDALEFPRNISKNAQSLIKRMCRENPVDRLGYQCNGLYEVMKHRWFQGFDWEGLRNFSLTPPFKRKVQDAVDARHFDRYPPDKQPVPDELSGWDYDF